MSDVEPVPAPFLKHAILPFDRMVSLEQDEGLSEQLVEAVPFVGVGRDLPHRKFLRGATGQDVGMGFSQLFEKCPLFLDQRTMRFRTCPGQYIGVCRGLPQRGFGFDLGPASNDPSCRQGVGRVFDHHLAQGRQFALGDVPSPGARRFEIGKQDQEFEGHRDVRCQLVPELFEASTIALEQDRFVEIEFKFLLVAFRPETGEDDEVQAIRVGTLSEGRRGDPFVDAPRLPGFEVAQDAQSDLKRCLFISGVHVLAPS